MLTRAGFTAVVAALLGVAPLLGAGVSPSPLLVSTRGPIVYADGDVRRSVAAGTRGTAYRLLSTLPDGSVLVGYRENGFTTVASISPALEAREIKRLPQNMASLVGPASDGFVAYDAVSGLLRRYDLHGSPTGSPAAATGVIDTLGAGDLTIAIGGGMLSAWDRGGRLRHQTILDATSLVALPNDRFAVVTGAQRDVRVFSSGFDLIATLRFPAGRPPRIAAGGPDGSLAVLIGTPSCLRSDAEVDVFDDVGAAQPRTRIRDGIGSAVALALSPDAVYVVNAGSYDETPFAPGSCRGPGSVAVFGRDGSTRGVLTDVGFPTGVVPLHRP